MQLEKETEKLVAKFGNPIEHNAYWNGDLSEVIYYMIEKDFKDVMTFADGKQIDLLEMLNENLEHYERACQSLRQQLKRPQLHNELEEEAAAAKK